MIDFDALASKKEDPNFSQISGHIPSELARRFRIVCADKELKVSEGLEQAIECWLKYEQNQSETKDTPAKPDKQ